MNLIWIESTRRIAGLAAMAAAATLAACTTMGSGTGSVSPGNTPVAFSWTSKDGGITGTMSATIDNTTQFSGPFLQETRNVRSESFGPLFGGWEGWTGVGGFPDDGISTSYSGRVIAKLAGADGSQLSCHFRLNDPISGMGGGGMGECQFAGGRTVNAVFARS